MPLKPLPQPSFTVVSPDRHWEQAWSDYMQGLDGYLRNELGVSLSGAVQSGSAIALTNNAPINITSITLSAGDWDVSANASFSGGATTTVAYFFASTSTTSANLGYDGGRGGFGADVQSDTVRRRFCLHHDASGAAVFRHGANYRLLWSCRRGLA